MNKITLALFTLSLSSLSVAAIPKPVIEQLKTFQTVHYGEANSDLNIYMKKTVVSEELATFVLSSICRSQYKLAPGQEAFSDDPKLADVWAEDKYKSINIVNDLGVGFSLPGGGRNCKTLGKMNSEESKNFFSTHLTKARVSKTPV